MNKFYIVNIPIVDYPEGIQNLIEKYSYKIETDYECNCISIYFDSKNKAKKFSNEFYNCK